MNKTILAFSFALLGLGMMSCKKDYTCSCKTTTYQSVTDSNGDPVSPAQTSDANSSSTIKDKEAEAKAQCEKDNGVTEQTTSSGQYTTYQKVTVACSLQ